LANNLAKKHFKKGKKSSYLQKISKTAKGFEKEV
jgi:hypothetical protein